MPKLTLAESRAIYAYLASGGVVSVYATRARALPPDYRDSDSNPPRIYCINSPVATYTESATIRV